MTAMSTPAATSPTAAECRNVCGEISLLARAGAVFVADATYCASLNRTPDAPSWLTVPVHKETLIIRTRLSAQQRP